VQVVAGAAHTCARRASGSVVCWGANDLGQLGDGSAVPDATAPTPVSGLNDSVQLAAGGGHTCARRAGGAIVCWGSNVYGELGAGLVTGATAHSGMPVTVLGIADGIDVAAGTEQTCVVAGGRVLCCGNDYDGQLGDGTRNAHGTPVEVMGLSDAVGVAAGGYFSCARRASGVAVCWGADEYSQLGDDTLGDAMHDRTTTVTFAAP
jgi:alpha-tubulin suppressor-like RCC1 family protein